MNPSNQYRSVKRQKVLKKLLYRISWFRTACMTATIMPTAIQPITSQGIISPEPAGIRFSAPNKKSGAIRSQVLSPFGQRFRNKVFAPRINKNPIARIASWPPGDVQNFILLPPTASLRYIIEISATTCNSEL